MSAPEMGPSEASGRFQHIVAAREATIRDPGRELLILGLLRRRPMSAYSLSRAVRRHAPLNRNFRGGNVYHAVAQLARRGLLLSKEAKARRGPAENKAIFRLSAAGERHFEALLKAMLRDTQTADWTLEIAYVLLGQFARQHALQLLAERSTEIVQQEKRLTRIWGNPDDRTGASYIAYLHTLSRLRAERRFLHDSIALLNDARWTPDWVRDDGSVEDPARRL